MARLQIRSASRTDVGKVRKTNQDNLGLASLPFGDLFVVCDGVGGHKGGAVASKMAVECLQEELAKAAADAPVTDTLEAAIRMVNAAVYKEATSGREDTQGMGTTLVLVLVRGNFAWPVNVGDSRCYLWRGGTLRQLTRDDSLVQRLIDENTMTEEQAKASPAAGVLLRAIGIDPKVQITFYDPVELQAGDTFLLCSDGLSGQVKLQQMESILRAHDDPQTAANKLVEAALEAGGPDNITAQVIRFDAEGSAAAAPQPAPARGRSRGIWLWICLGLLVLLALWLLQRWS